MEKGNLQKPSKKKHVQQMHYLLTFKDITKWDTLTPKLVLLIILGLFISKCVYSHVEYVYFWHNVFEKTLKSIQNTPFLENSVYVVGISTYFGLA